MTSFVGRDTSAICCPMWITSFGKDRGLQSSSMAGHAKLLRYLHICLVVILEFPFLIDPTPVYATMGETKAPKASCRIEVDNAHISSSILKHRKTRFVKINARSICNVPQQRVLLTLEIYKTGIFGNHFVVQFQTNPIVASSSGLKVEIANAAVKCLNNKTTRYFGIAYSKAIIQGAWQYAGRTRSTHIVPLNCGT